MSFHYENIKLSLSDQIMCAQKHITNRNTSDNTPDNNNGAQFNDERCESRKKKYYRMRKLERRWRLRGK